MPPDEGEDSEANDTPDLPPTAEESPYEFEDRFKMLLSTMSLTDIGGGRRFYFGEHQIDACGGVGDSLIIFDCTIRRGTKATPRQLRTKIEGWRGKYPTLVKAVHEHPDYSKYKEVVVAIAANANVSDADLKYAVEGSPSIRILNRQHIDYLTTIANDIGVYARYRLATILKVHVHRTTTLVPAIRVDDRGRTMFLFAAEATDLAELAFVPQAEVGFKYFYQRLINKGKLNSIRNFVRDSPRPFPNSVILAIDRAPAFDTESAEVPVADTAVVEGVLHLPEVYGSCWVVDGQHRIYGSALSGTHVALPVALIPATDLEKARYFFDINSTQTKIDPNLKWDLAAQLVPESSDGKVSITAQKLDELESPLKGKIRIPHKGLSSTRTVKLSGLCDALVRNRLYQTLQYDFRVPEFTTHLSNDLAAWFSQVATSVQDETTKDRFLFDNSGLSVLAILFKRVVKRLENKRPTLAVLTEYAAALAAWTSKYSAEEVGGLVKQCSSEAGRSIVANGAATSMNEVLPVERRLEVTAESSPMALEAVRFEADLRTKVDEELKQKLGADWFAKANFANQANPPESAARLGLGQIRSLLQREPYSALAREGFDRAHVKPEFGFHLLEYVSNYRNDTLHGNYAQAARYDMELVKTGMKTLRKCFRLGA